MWRGRESDSGEGVKGRKSIKGREGDRIEEVRKRDGWRQSWGRMVLKRLGWGTEEGSGLIPLITLPKV